MSQRVLPNHVVDTLLHQKMDDRREVVILPITRYANVMSAPNVVTDSDEIPGAPFHLLKTTTELMSVEQIRILCGGIL